MKYKVAQAIGLNTDQKAAQVVSSVRDDNNLFIAVLQLISDDAFTRGRQLLSDLSDFYFENEGTPSQKLTETFKEAEKRLSNLDSQPDQDIKEEVTDGDEDKPLSFGEQQAVSHSARNEEEAAPVSYELLLAAVSGKVLYLIRKGEISSYLKRGEKVTSLLDIAQSNQLISGFLQENDKVFFATNTLIDFMGENLKDSLNLSLEEWEDETTSKIGGAEVEDKGLAGLVLEVKPEKMGESEQSIPEPQLSNVDHTAYASLQKRPSLEKVKVLFSALLSHLPKPSRGESQTYLYEKRGLKKFIPESGKGKLILALLLIAVIGSGVFIKYKNDRDAQNEVTFNEHFQKAHDDFSAAVGLQTLNPVEAKNRLDEANESLNKALAIKPKDEEALRLRSEIQLSESSILQQFSATEFPLFLDMDLVKDGFRATHMSLSVGKLLLLDTNTKTLVSVDLAKKSHLVLAGKEQLGEGVGASINGNLAFVYSEDKGVVRVDTTNQKASEVSKVDSGWGNIVDIAGFGGNAYLLDSINNQIWKYVPTASGYSNKIEYLSSSTKADFSGAKRMQIESSIYVLKQGGEILRYTRGVSDHFSIGGLDKPINNPQSFFVSSDTDNLYILDTGNSRLVVVNKTGGYKGQYQGDKFGTASDLAVDEKDKKVYLLEGNKIFQVDLK